MSPRSGTPVKLLGREDASVDWYNLEKSKRVKAFRCGEFDACIEKAEASMGVPIKKREKYARREDAILHALELEKKQLEMENKSITISNGIASKYLDTPKRELNDLSTSDLFARNDESPIQSQYPIHKSSVLPRRATLLHEEDIMNDSKDMNNQTQRDEHISEVTPRMRGLQDFGLRTAPKKKLPPSVAWLTTKKAAESNSNALPPTGSMGGAGHASVSKDMLAVKKKRSFSGLTEESLVKKRDRRRPLHQVLQSSAKLQVFHSSQLDQYPPLDLKLREKNHIGTVFREKESRCLYLPVASVDSQDNGGYSSEETETIADQLGMDNCLNQSGSLAEDCTSSGMLEANESDSSLGNYLEADVQGDILRDTGRSLASGTKDCGPSSCFATDKLGEINNDEMPFSSYISDLQPYQHPADTSTEVGVSKWHMKGKRNIRNLIKRPNDAMDEKIHVTGSDKCNLSVMEAAFETKSSSLKMEEIRPSAQSAGYCHAKGEDNYDSDNLIGEDYIEEQMNGYNDQRCPSVSKTARGVRGRHIGFKDLDSDSHLMSTSGWEAATRGVQSKYWEESEPVYDAHIGRETGFILFDVNVNVKASYQGERVPLVSLMSRLNGKAIVGHPVQIEILDDSTSHYLSGNYSYPEDCTAHQPVWRTARRTSMQRVPRSNPVTSTLDGDDAGGSHYSVQEKERPVGTSHGHSKSKSKLSKKKSYHSHRSPSGRFQKKSLKTISLSSQKTRTLSSFANEHRLGVDKGAMRLARSSSTILSGFTKPERQVPLVTCVPLKVAFSRILEAVGRPSTTATHRLQTSNHAIKEPS